MHVQTMGKCDRCTLFQVVMHVFFVCVGLQFVGHGEHDQIAPCGGFGNAHNLEAFAFGFLGRGGAFAQGNDQIFRTGIAQVQRVGVALRAVTKDGYLFVFDQVDVAIAVVINAHVVVLSGDVDRCRITILNE